MLVIIKIPVANEQCLTLCYNLHLTQVVAYKCAARAYNIKYSICHADTRTNLHTTSNDMYVGLYIMLSKILAQNIGVRRSDALVVKPMRTCVFHFFRNGKRKTTLAKTKMRQNLHILATLHILVLTNNTNVGYTRSYTLRDIVIAQEKYLEWKIRRLCNKGAFA